MRKELTFINEIEIDFDNQELFVFWNMISAIPGPAAAPFNSIII
jgi:hypothetical protein